MLSGLGPGAARSRAEGVTAKPTGASPVNPCAGVSHFPQPRNKKGSHRPVGVTASPSFRASPGLVSDLGSGPAGPVELGTACKLILSTKPVLKASRALSRASTPDR